MSGTCSPDTPEPSGRICERDVLAAIFGVFVGMAIGLAVHLGLAFKADRIHESAQATISDANALALRTCNTDLARYAGIDPKRCREYAALDEAYRNRRPGQ